MASCDTMEGLVTNCINCDINIMHNNVYDNYNNIINYVNNENTIYNNVKLDNTNVLVYNTHIKNGVMGCTLR